MGESRFFKSIKDGVRQTIGPARPTKASEILAGALELWGPNGEGWVTGRLEHNGKLCLIGGISKVACGKATYMGGELIDNRAYLRAMELIRSEISEEPPDRLLGPWDVEADLYQFNDDGGHGFHKVKGAVCNALKRALDEEGEEKECSNE